MNLIDIVIVVAVVLVLVNTLYLMNKKKKDNCSGTCLGCSLEKTCSTKNIKKMYDEDKISSKL